MSYYDHATLMAHRLGPWADAGARQASMVDRELTRHHEMACPVVRHTAPGVFARLWQRLKRRRVPQSRCCEPL
ncbi:hypothetical protein IMCC20628_04317 [Hoeflea sp. IMCC20628]|uniref:hypothetical protein n=1 Tax=Hoeflea sp. IMCC20628 TaxID=1620421 RepID=UPI00063AB09A|nr:hypothetical protein [Hoeflea sp. IMCC20628]AKI02993.1 hypothetical protein IMCC20628_04317 [Hoeflea sp. IMCC20628]